jgi:hypothetical protein
MGQIIKYTLMMSSVVLLLSACPERKKIPPVPPPTPPAPETTVEPSNPKTSAYRLPVRGMAPPCGFRIVFYQMLA